MAFGRKGTIVGRPAKPGEVVNRKGIPVTAPRTGAPVAKSKPRPQS